MPAHHSIVIVGGGSAGITVAARLLNADPQLDVAIVEPSDTHYYQPLWTLVGGGQFPREITARPQADYIPPGATWLRDHVDRFEPASNRVILRRGGELEYDQLVVCAGIQCDWDAIEGLGDALARPDSGVCSNYSYDTVEATWRAIAGLRSGRALFTAPSTTLKCGGAPQKVMWIAEENFRKRGVRGAIEVSYAIAGPRIFGVAKYRRTLERLVVERDIVTRFGHDLIAVDGGRKRATFRRKDDGGTVELDYAMMHVTPPQSSPSFIRASELADAGGWVEVDKHTTQHVRFANVFSLGDCSSLPCSKTGAAVRKQAPVTVANLLALRAGQPLTASYDGYSSCPIITGIGQVMLAEFDYDGTPRESFPFDQAQPRYSMYLLKAYALPEIYWNGMLRGQM